MSSYLSATSPVRARLRSEIARLRRRVRPLALAWTSAGAVLGILVLHPMMEAVYWFEFHTQLTTATDSLWRSIGHRLWGAFLPAMFPMTGLFGLIGETIGLGFGVLATRPSLMVREVPGAGDPVRKVMDLIAAGEGERTEFKSSIRWDSQLGRLNRALEEAVVRTIAGFANHQGGALLLGVTDTGEVIGLAGDYQTLKRPNQDGLHQFLIGLVHAKLGGHLCSQIHVRFINVGGRDVCCITVEASAGPAYYRDGSVARYYLRTGNGTRELDVLDATRHMTRRWPAAGYPSLSKGGQHVNPG